MEIYHTARSLDEDAAWDRDMQALISSPLPPRHPDVPNNPTSSGSSIVMNLAPIVPDGMPLAFRITRQVEEM